MTTLFAPTNCGTDVVVTNTATETTVSVTNTGVAADLHREHQPGQRGDQVPHRRGQRQVKFTGLVEDTTYTVTVNIGTAAPW